MNDLAIHHSRRDLTGHSAQAELGAELAKILMLVAPVSMTAEQHELWLRSAVAALDGIGVHEVRAILLELQRKVRRPADIVPEIASLVAERRKHPTVGKNTNERCACGKGTKARTGRTDVHWIKEDGVPRIEYCEAGQ